MRQRPGPAHRPPLRNEIPGYFQVSGGREADERCDDEATYVGERLRVQVLIFDSLPRTSSSPPKERSCGGFSRASCVDSATRIDRPVVFVIASRRDAVFTVSP